MITPRAAGAAALPLVCTSVVTAACDQRDTRLVAVGLVAAPRPMCAACRASADALGLPIRPWVERSSDRRRNRFAFAGEGIGRRVADALAARRSRMAH